MKQLAQQKITKITRQPSLFISQEDEQIEKAFELLPNSSIRTVVSELIFGKIYGYIVFYDMTTLSFEASNENDLRKMGFSKDGKLSNPQIFIGNRRIFDRLRYLSRQYL